MWCAARAKFPLFLKLHFLSLDRVSSETTSLAASTVSRRRDLRAYSLLHSFTGLILFIIKHVRIRGWQGDANLWGVGPGLGSVDRAVFYDSDLHGAPDRALGYTAPCFSGAVGPLSGPFPWPLRPSTVLVSPLFLLYFFSLKLISVCILALGGVLAVYHLAKQCRSFLCHLKRFSGTRGLWRRRSSSFEFNRAPINFWGPVRRSQRARIYLNSTFHWSERETWPLQGGLRRVSWGVKILCEYCDYYSPEHQLVCTSILYKLYNVGWSLLTVLIID